MGAKKLKIAANEDSDSLKLWKAMHGAFDFLNESLFNGRLDRNKIVLNCSHSSSRTLGFYHAKTWGTKKNAKAEISLNPDEMEGEKIQDIFATLLHEMCHYEQDLFGKPGKNGYHNKQWASMMLAVGLKPVNIKDHSKTTGMSCHHSIIKDGPFDKAMKKMPKELQLPFVGLRRSRRKVAKGYMKFACRACSTIVRAKPQTRVLCANCTEETGINVPLICQGY